MTDTFPTDADLEIEEVAALQPKTLRMEVRISPALLQDVERWRAANAPDASTSAVIRHLIAKGIRAP